MNEPTTRLDGLVFLPSTKVHTINCISLAAVSSERQATVGGNKKQSRYPTVFETETSAADSS